jgi:hypothetical protein
MKKARMDQTHYFRRVVDEEYEQHRPFVDAIEALRLKYRQSPESFQGAAWPPTVFVPSFWACVHANPALRHHPPLHERVQPLGARDPLLANVPEIEQMRPLMELLTGVVAWRMAQGVYRFEPDLARRLWEQSLDWPLPVSMLRRLPEWSVFGQLPIVADGGDGMQVPLDFTAHLDVRLLQDGPGAPFREHECLVITPQLHPAVTRAWQQSQGADPLSQHIAQHRVGDARPFLVPLIEGLTASECIERGRLDRNAAMRRELASSPAGAAALAELERRLPPALPQLLNAVLYLCHPEADIRGQCGVPQRLEPAHEGTRRRDQARRVRLWDVGSLNTGVLPEQILGEVKAVHTSAAQDLTGDVARSAHVVATSDAVWPQPHWSDHKARRLPEMMLQARVASRSDELKVIDLIHRRRPRDWPASVYVPSFYVAVSQLAMSTPADSLEREFNAAQKELRLEAELDLCLASWRIGRNVYRMDGSLALELAARSCGPVPTERLHELPDWCVYVEAPELGRLAAFDRTNGFFAFFDYQEVYIPQPRGGRRLEQVETLMMVVIDEVEAAADRPAGVEHSIVRLPLMPGRTVAECLALFGHEADEAAGCNPGSITGISELDPLSVARTEAMVSILADLVSRTPARHVRKPTAAGLPVVVHLLTRQQA